MLLDFSVDWRWVIGGTDVSPFVETWELAREQPDLGTPAWWRGKLVLRPVVGRDLNLDPLTNSLWRQGTSCSLTVAGSLVFTGSILLVYYDDWSTAPRLELEVGDVLAAKNHRQVIPFGEYDAQSLLRALGIPGVAPAGDKVEISTDLTSPVKVVQELTWVAGLKSGLPATLFTHPNGQVTYVKPQAEISLTRTLEQVADLTRLRPALEIPGSVIASANLTYLIKPTVTNREPPRGGPPRGGPLISETIVSKEGETTKVTYIDSLGRPIIEKTYIHGILQGRAEYNYYVDAGGYEISKNVWIKGQGGFYLFEYTKERAERVRGTLISTGNRGRGSDMDSGPSVSGRMTAQKRISIRWPASRLFPTTTNNLVLAYLIEEYSFRTNEGRPYLLRLTTRARGTTQDTDTLEEAVALSPVVSDIIPNQEIQFPAWAQPQQQEEEEQLERITDTLSEEVAVVGFTGPPVYLTVPWLSTTVDEPVESGDLGQRIGSLRQRLRYSLRAAASWMATEIGGRAFARRIKMPVPPEWLGDPRPWTLARIGNEVFWLVGEILRGTNQGAEFEATGILAGRPNTIPDSPDGIPFIPLVTVMPTRFPQVGIGCEMSAGEMVAIPGDPWLGMAVEIEYATSDPAASVIIGIGVGEPTEAWLGLAADAAYEITGEEEEEDGEAQGLTLEAEDGEIDYGVLFYDGSASSCYAVGPEEEFYFSVFFNVDSTSIIGDRPLRVRVIYKSTGNAEIFVTTFHDGNESFYTFFQVSATVGYAAEEIEIPVGAEPFERIWISVYRYSSVVYLDAIQLTSATGDWPPLNPCS